MKARGLVHHIDLTVSNVALSRIFYDRVLGYLGYERADDHPDGSDWNRIGSEPFHSIGIVRTHGTGATKTHDRYAPGLHHLAWTADSRDDVDHFHDLLIEWDVPVLDTPADYPRYGPDYYAVFFADPDGLKLEFVSGATGAAI
jgi:glyoxylase I family protein